MPGLAVVAIDDVDLRRARGAVAVPALAARASDRPARATPGRARSPTTSSSPSRRPERGQRADLRDPPAPGTSCSRPPRSTSDGGPTSSAAEGRCASRARRRRATPPSPPTRTASGGASTTRSRGSTSFAVAAAEVATGEPVDREDFDEDGSWIDYRGPPETFPTLLVLAGARREVDPIGVRGQDRRRRRLGADAAGRPPDLDRRRPDGRAPRSRRTRSRPCSTGSRCAPRRPSSTLLLIAAARASWRRCPGCACPRWPRSAIAIAAGRGYLVAAQLAFDAGS